MKVLSLFGLRSLHLIHILAFLCHDAAANTEIINFSASRALERELLLGLLGNWSTLRPTDNDRRLSIEPAALHTPLHHVCDDDEWSTCPHARWLVLDLDDPRWAAHAAFTLRLSWPASSGLSLVEHVLVWPPPPLKFEMWRPRTPRSQTPTDFAIELYTPHALLRLLARGRSGGGGDANDDEDAREAAGTTRVRYARISAVHAGVPVPASPLPDAQTAAVPFAVILEPLYGGVLPASLLPTVGVLVPVVLAAALLVRPRVTAYLDPWVRQAREEMHRLAKTS